MVLFWDKRARNDGTTVNFVLTMTQRWRGDMLNMRRSAHWSDRRGRHWAPRRRTDCGPMDLMRHPGPLESTELNVKCNRTQYKKCPGRNTRILNDQKYYFFMGTMIENTKDWNWLQWACNSINELKKLNRSKTDQSYSYCFLFPFFL